MALPQASATRIVVDAPTASNSNTAVGSVAVVPVSVTTGSYAQHVVVIDWISYYNVAGGADENWQLTIIDDNNATILAAGETVAAGTAGSFFMQFVGGMPMFNLNGTLNQSLPSACTSSQATVTVAGSVTAAGILTVGLHYEHKSTRHP